MLPSKWIWSDWLTASRACPYSYSVPVLQRCCADGWSPEEGSALASPPRIAHEETSPAEGPKEEGISWLPTAAEPHPPADVTDRGGGSDAEESDRSSIVSKRAAAVSRSAVAGHGEGNSRLCREHGSNWTRGFRSRVRRLLATQGSCIFGGTDHRAEPLQEPPTTDWGGSSPTIRVLRNARRMDAWSGKHPPARQLSLDIVFPAVLPQMCRDLLGSRCQGRLAPDVEIAWPRCHSPSQTGILAGVFSQCAVMSRPGLVTYCFSGPRGVRALWLLSTGFTPNSPARIATM